MAGNVRRRSQEYNQILKTSSKYISQKEEHDLKGEGLRETTLNQHHGTHTAEGHPLPVLAAACKQN